MANIILNTKTYSGAGVTNGIARYVERSLGVAGGFSNLTALVKESVKETLVRWRLAIPVVQTESTACACPGALLRTHRVEISVQFAPNTPAAEREDVLLRIPSLIGTTEFETSVSDLLTPAG